MKDRIQGFLDFLKIEKGYADNTIAAYQNDDLNRGDAK